MSILEEYKKKLDELIALESIDCQTAGISIEACDRACDHLRDEMDELWDKMTDEDIESVRKYAASQRIYRGC